MTHNPLSSIRLRPATSADLVPVLDLLEKAQLPAVGVPEHFASFTVAADGETVVGAIGLELYGDTALLRSAVVAPELRGQRLGTRLLDHARASARAAGVCRLLLLTTTAEMFFGAHGFRPVDRGAITGPVTASMEFRGACPDTAVCMEQIL